MKNRNAPDHYPLWVALTRTHYYLRKLREKELKKMGLSVAQSTVLAIIHGMPDNVDATPAELRQIRRQIGMIFQHFNLVKRSSVMTNILSGRLGYANPLSTLAHQFSQADRKKAEEALQRVGLEVQKEKRADELSGGQQQRVGIARALMQDPKMILADEPVASLDPVLAHTILGYIEKMNVDLGITVLCSLHYLDLVQRYATRVIGLRDGQIVYSGTRDDIQRMTDAEFKEIYGEEAERVSAGPRSLEGSHES